MLFFLFGVTVFSCEVMLGHYSRLYVCPAKEKSAILAFLNSSKLHRIRC